ncbi:D-2-hydroxyacid dehydrogenase [Candidatus Micrarchaeota archaeon]|nr:D-2-hydroxyacid dehydrogenase [Candidatus Micrarchaeota archaeon]
MKILVCDTMQEEVLDGIKKLGEVEYKPENLMESAKDAEVMVVRSATKITKEVVESAPKLKAVIRAGVGLDNVDAEYCKERGIKVLNTPGASSNAVAELAIGMMVCLMRGVYRGHEEMKKGNWIKKQLLGNEIEGKTLGIVGFGRIGSMVAQKAKALGMNVVAYDPRPKESEFAESVSLDELFKKSDVISLHTVLVPETKNLINEESIMKMKDGVYLLNMARGPLIDGDALFEGLKNGKVGGAALDVYWEEPYKGKLLELNNVFFSPHIGGNTKEAQIKIGMEVVEHIRQLG